MSGATCSETVWDRSGWSSWQCGNLAKFVVAHSSGNDDHPVCGVHVRWYRKYGIVRGAA